MSTHPYWTAPTQFRQQKMLRPISGDLGFQFNIPWPMPSSAGYYFGEEAPWGRREHVYSSLPEWFSVNNIVPASGGLPLVNPHSSEMTFDRERFTVRK